MDTIFVHAESLNFHLYLACEIDHDTKRKFSNTGQSDHYFDVLLLQNQQHYLWHSLTSTKHVLAGRTLGVRKLKPCGGSFTSNLYRIKDYTDSEWLNLSENICTGTDSSCWV